MTIHLWRWQIVRRNVNEAAGDSQLAKDPILGELQHDLMVTRSIVIVGFGIGLCTLLAI